MRASISTSNRLSLAMFLAGAAFLSVQAFAADPPPGGAAPAGKDRTLQPEESDFSGTPYTEYGEFNEEAEEESDTRFFQHGRFFGVSIGSGIEAVDGNRGALWSGGFPVIDFKVHYWFDFNFALDLGFTTASHNYSTNVKSLGQVDVSMLRLGVNLRYYFDTKNLSAPISFANPYVLVGAGSYTKNEFSFNQSTTDSDTSIGLSAGFGLEFTLKPRKTYFQVEGKMHLVRFRDTDSSDFASPANSNDVAVPDLHGNFYTITGNLLFTW